MPIVHDRKLIFIHIPKTGGTSISSHFFNFKQGLIYDEDCLLSSIITVGEGKYRRASHCKAQEIKDAHPDTFQAYKKIAVVRNPFDRLLSGYYHFSRGAHDIPNIGTVGKLEFNDYVARLCSVFDNIHDLQSLKHEDYYIHLCPQVEFLKIDGVISNEIKIYRFEEFDEISRDFGITRELNRNPANNWGAKYHQFYNSDSILMVQQMYKEDLEVLNYSFGDRIDKNI